jgi:NADPH-dependent curcumin reductase CurA
MEKGRGSLFERVAAFAKNARFQQIHSSRTGAPGLKAASVPIGSLTGWQGLFERAKLQAGERILVHGGSGAVGVFVIQLARRAGAHVITTASARNFDFFYHSLEATN